MELLPVIYWSLFSVGVSALIVILFSFLTFQFRKKYGHIPSEEVIGDERNKKVTVTNPDKKSKEKRQEKKHHPKVQTRSRKKDNPVPRVEKKDTEDISLYKKPTRDDRRKRVQVINENTNDRSSSHHKSDGDIQYHSIKLDSKHKGWN